MVKTEDEQVFFVPVQGPTVLRKNILGGVKKILVLLKRYEKFRFIREEKVKRMHELRVILKELDFLNKKLERTLPKTHLREIDKPIQQLPSMSYRRPKNVVSDLDKLEYELQHIEHKLQKLD